MKLLPEVIAPLLPSPKGERTDVRVRGHDRFDDETINGIHSVFKSIEETEARVNSSTYARRRAEFMGFSFTRFHVHLAMDMIEVSGGFTCVCGQQEAFRIRTPMLDLLYAWSGPKMNDPVQWLENLGSFSADHLLNDGYSLEHVRKIVEQGAQFDKSEGRPLRDTYNSDIALLDRKEYERSHQADASGAGNPALSCAACRRSDDPTRRTSS